MLIQFVVENFLSFRDETVLDMQGSGDSPRRCAAIYGANAAGKSNIIKAMTFARSLVVDGTEKGEKIAVKPFKLDKECAARPSRFQFDFVADGQSYSYGFVVDAERVHAEWLDSGDDDEVVRLFEREWDEVTGQDAFRVDPALASTTDRQRFLEFVHQGTRANQLLLNYAQEREVDELMEVTEWFAEMVIIEPDDVFHELSIEAQENPAFRRFLGRLLQEAGTGIRKVRAKRTKVDPRRTNFRSVRRLLEASGGAAYSDPGTASVVEDGDVFLYLLVLAHQGGSGDVSFRLKEESDGTRRLLDLAPVLFAKDEPGLILIDELDRSLHPLLTRLFLRRFLEHSGDEHSAQLVFTTHDTNLLGLEELDAASVWFAEKDQQGASHLYSLAEFEPEQLKRLGTANRERGYLMGRFGAIPYLGDAGELLAKLDEN